MLTIFGISEIFDVLEKNFCLLLKIIEGVVVGLGLVWLEEVESKKGIFWVWNEEFWGRAWIFTCLE